MVGEKRQSTHPHNELEADESKVRSVEIDGSHVTMMGIGMVLGEVVAEVFFATFPMDVELALTNAVSHPIKSHVNGFGTFLFHRVIDDAFGACIVSLDGCGWLRVTKENESVAQTACVLCIVEEGTHFGFSG